MHRYQLRRSLGECGVALRQRLVGRDGFDELTETFIQRRLRFVMERQIRRQAHELGYLADAVVQFL